MKKALTIIRILVTMSLSMVIINQYNTMTIQANQATIERTNSSKTMNESEAAIIRDIKQACLYLVSQSISPEEVAAKFGTPAKNPMNPNEVEPFNINFQTVRASVSYGSKNPLAADSVDITLKPNKISIKALKQEFGEYFHNFRTSRSAPESVRFDTKIVYKGVEKECEIFVDFRRPIGESLPRGMAIKNESTESITIRFSDIVL